MDRHFPSVQIISSDKLAVWLAGDMPPPALIDVRQREEYEVSHLPYALHLPTVEAIQQAVIPDNFDAGSLLFSGLPLCSRSATASGNRL